MTENTHRQQQAKVLRLVRKIHRYTGASLFLIFLFVSITGLLLGWKKDSGGYLLPNTQRGISTNPTEWMYLDELQILAAHLLDSLDHDLDPTIDRLDIRPERGIVKFTFQHHYQELQLDLATGELLSYGKRRSDWLEHVHDGSIVDLTLGTGFFKLLYTSVAGLALLTFTVTGFWLWYGPRRMRAR
jgi:hypothetical protein